MKCFQSLHTRDGEYCYVVCGFQWSDGLIVALNVWSLSYLFVRIANSSLEKSLELVNSTGLINQLRHAPSHPYGDSMGQTEFGLRASFRGGLQELYQVSTTNLRTVLVTEPNNKSTFDFIYPEYHIYSFLQQIMQVIQCNRYFVARNVCKIVMASFILESRKIALSR